MQGNGLGEILDALAKFFLAPENRLWIFVILGGLVVLLALLIVQYFLRRRHKKEPLLPPELHVELDRLVNEGPPAGLPIFEFYNLPVRLAGVVFAPVGRMRELPPPAELSAVFESVLPGLGCVVERHAPLVRYWPHQVSTRGFATSFFTNIRLPGDRGKGTPWSAVAGIFMHDGVPIMIGLVLRAAAANSLGQIVVNTEHEWLGCLRVRQ
jgi:purine-cytosine permease-like protein